METIEQQIPGAVAVRTHIDYVSQLLRAHGHPNPTAWEAHLVPEARITNNSALMRFLINATWRHILATVTTESTLSVRYNLLDKGSAGDWERLFLHVVPFIVKHQLPVASAT